MIRYENECCSCSVPAYPCLGDICPRLRVPHFYCDECGCEEQLYYYEGRQLCISCIEQLLEKVNEE